MPIESAVELRNAQIGDSARCRVEEYSDRPTQPVVKLVE